MGKFHTQKIKKAVADRKGMWRYNYCAPELKLIFISLLLFCSVATLFQFLPTYFYPLSSSTTTSCPTTITTPTTTTTITTPTTTTTINPSPPLQPADKTLSNGVIKRSFYPVGTAAYNFVLMSAYRGGPNTFAIIGLSSKSLHDYGNPTYTCEYQSDDVNQPKITVPGKKLSFQDFGYARVYVVVVVNCTFLQPSTTINGGRLILHATTNGVANSTNTIIALTETPNSWNPSQFHSPPKYEYLYCGSSLFGELSPQRVREWMAYHVRLFGSKSHFVFHDAGGIHPEVMDVLKPWKELGFVTVHDIKEQERFDAFYHNQMLVINDCLHRHRFATKWMFFFDVDEYIYLSNGDSSSLGMIMDSVKEYTLFNIEQVSMSNRICLAEDAAQIDKKWGFEKLVYKNAKKMRRDMKYAIQPRNVYATGVHASENFDGKATRLPKTMMKYFHYHGTVANRREPCRQLTKDSSTTVENTPYVRDNAMRSMATLVKKFELDTIGSRLQSTKL